MSTPGVARAHAAKAIAQVIFHNRTIDWVLENKTEWTATPLERELLFGVVRKYPSLYNAVNHFLDKPLRDKDHDLLALLLVGTYQLFMSSKKSHAIINETVAGAERLHKKWAKGLINAILRNIQRQERTLEKLDQTFGQAKNAQQHRHDHPPWLADRLAQQYPLQWQDILLANNQRAPMALRVNRMKISRVEYGNLLTNQSVEFTDGLPVTCLMLDSAIPSKKLPGWEDGYVAVQDMAAQFAAELLLAHGSATLRILDACAAPGGKLAHLIEALESKQATVHGVDNSAKRIENTQQILKRLGHTVEITLGDAATQSWWDGKSYSHILLDAPCSGTGTLRRHPDIKWLLKAENIPAQAELQRQILHNLWHMLDTGGTLLYCTCSLLDAENDAVIEQFLTDHQNEAQVLNISLPTGLATRYGWQLLPTDPHTDGFYYALLSKTGSPGTP